MNLLLEALSCVWLQVEVQPIHLRCLDCESIFVSDRNTIHMLAQCGKNFDKKLPQKRKGPRAVESTASPPSSEMFTLVGGGIGKMKSNFKVQVEVVLMCHSS